jgi:hypothetical protein
VTPVPWRDLTIFGRVGRCILFAVAREGLSALEPPVADVAQGSGAGDGGAPAQADETAQLEAEAGDAPVGVLD